MRFRKLILFILLLTVMLFAAYLLQDNKTGKADDTAMNYKPVPHWLSLPDSIQLGNPTGIGIDSNQNVFIFHRAGREWPLIVPMPQSTIANKTILLIDHQTGKLINSWGDHLFIMPHGLAVDHQDNVWVTDVGLHQIFKFNHEGKLLLKLGIAGIAGNDATHFNRPTDIAVTKDGSFYVSDGYGNSRVIKFSPAGKYLFEWGKKGSQPGEFNIPHGIDLDTNGNVYVADRENNRVQKFDSMGHFVKLFSDQSFASVCSVTFDKSSSKLFVADDLSFLKIKHRGADIFSIDSAGKIDSRFGRTSLNNEHICWYHDLGVDREQNIYAGDILGNDVKKFTIKGTQ